jgi:hypothetical protein
MVALYAAATVVSVLVIIAAVGYALDRIGGE